MTLNDVYLVSQIAAAVLVAPTLLYLALQVRQNTVQLRAAARYQFVEASGQLLAVLCGSTATASVFRRGLESFDGLDPDERMQFFVFVGQFFQIYSVMFELHADRLLPDSQWHNVRKDIVSVLSSPGGQRVWEDFAMKGLDPKFVAFVAALRTGAEPSYDMTAMGKRP